MTPDPYFKGPLLFDVEAIQAIQDRHMVIQTTNRKGCGLSHARSEMC